MFYKYPFFSFPLVEPWPTTSWTGKVSCVYSGIASQLLYLVTTVFIEETSFLAKPWPMTAGITRTRTSGYEDRRTVNTFLLLWSRQIPRTSGPPPLVVATIYKISFMKTDLKDYCLDKRITPVRFLSEKRNFYFKYSTEATEIQTKH